MDAGGSRTPAIAISLTAGKLTARTLAQALSAALRQIRQQRRAALTPQGRQSVKKLMNHGVNTNGIPLDGSTRLFDRVARKYNVDYAFRKVGPKQYRLFFKAGQAACHYRLLCGIHQTDDAERAASLCAETDGTGQRRYRTPASP